MATFNAWRKLLKTPNLVMRFLLALLCMGVSQICPWVEDRPNNAKINSQKMRYCKSKPDAAVKLVALLCEVIQYYFYKLHSFEAK